MYNIPEGTLFAGKKVISVPECHSTNDFAAQIVQHSSAGEGTLVITNKQTAGKGQRGAEWLSEPGQNLTFSLVLIPSFLDPKDQFFLTMCIALGVYDLVRREVASEAYIKWPNDIMVCGKKICGILIENQLRGSRFVSSIAGIGLNVNQQTFPFPTATSLSLIKQQSYGLEDVLHDLLACVERRYLQLRQGDREGLKSDYMAVLYWKGEPHTFLAGETRFRGIIRGLDASGRLHIDEEGRDRFFAVKEVEYIN